MFLIFLDEILELGVILIDLPGFLQKLPGFLELAVRKMQECQIGQIDDILAVEVHGNLQIALGKLRVSAFPGADGKLVVDLGVLAVDPEAFQKIFLSSLVVLQNAFGPASEEEGFPAFLVSCYVLVHGLKGIVRTSHHHLVVGVHDLVLGGEHLVDVLQGFLGVGLLLGVGFKLGITGQVIAGAFHVPMSHVVGGNLAVDGSVVLVSGLAFVEDLKDPVVIHVGFCVLAVLVELDGHLGVEDCQVDVAFGCVGQMVDCKHELLCELIVLLVALGYGCDIELFYDLRLKVEKKILIVLEVAVFRIPGHDLDQAGDNAVEVDVVSDASFRELDGKGNVLADGDFAKLPVLRERNESYVFHLFLHDMEYNKKKRKYKVKEKGGKRNFSL